jgi:hypothetical protein
MVVGTYGGKMVSAPNDILVILGVVIWLLFIILSLKTKCLTDLPRFTWRHK